jgi:uncharacterized membrane protein
MINRAYHGKQALSDDVVRDMYSTQVLAEFDGVSTARFLVLTTYFERPIGPLYALLVGMSHVVCSCSHDGSGDTMGFGFIGT